MLLRLGIWVELRVDKVERQKRLSQRKRQRRTDLQNQKAIFHQLVQVLSRLIVR